MDAYKTLQKAAVTEYIVQKSRFIGHAAPVTSAEEALAFLEKIRLEHRSASHNCFAYVIGRNQGIIRYSDDGEPSGTAGKPMAEVLLKQDVTDCIVVITRYFGGILLGAGGLVRAYTHTAVLALQEAVICSMHETARWHLDIAYPLWDRVDHAFKTLPVIVENSAYAQNVRVSLLLRVADEEKTLRELMKVTDGKIDTRREEETTFTPWPG